MACNFERLTELDASKPTLIEGMPGLGLVASIAADHVRTELDLARHGRVESDAFPQVATYTEGLVRDTVRVYGGTDPDVLTLHSDVVLPQEAYRPLARCVTADLSDRLGRALFLAGAPADSEESIGRLRGVATTEDMRESLTDAGVPLADDPGAIGGVTGALAHECFQTDVPAAVLIVDAHPYLPDPAAARIVIEEALEPLVDFEIDTTALAEQADQIETSMQQIAEQYRRAAQGDRETRGGPTPMFQ